MTISQKDIKTGDLVVIDWGQMLPLRPIFFPETIYDLYDAFEKNDSAFRIKSINRYSEIAKVTFHTDKRKHKGNHIFEFPLEVLHKIYED